MRTWLAEIVAAAGFMAFAGATVSWFVIAEAMTR